MASLKDIAYRLGTDKKHTRHDYVSVYEPLFDHLKNKRGVKLLEIGVSMCRSHNMWAEWFTDAEIYGIDIEFNPVYKKHPNIFIDIVDQSSGNAMIAYINKGNGPWDVIIDDGSHKSADQVLSHFLLWPHVKPGGYYIVEDIQYAYWEKGPNLIDHMDELRDIICHVPKVKGTKPYSGFKWRSERENLDYYQKTIESVTYRTGLVILKKRNEEDSQL